MTQEKITKILSEFDEKFQLTRHGIVEKRPSHLGNAYHDDFGVIKSFLSQKLKEARSQALKRK